MPVNPLTVQEAEVARLVAQGLTNRRIAKTLGVEVSTVNTHVHHALGKLELSGRVALARWVFERERERERRHTDWWSEPIVSRNHQDCGGWSADCMLSCRSSICWRRGDGSSARSAVLGMFLLALAGMALPAPRASAQSVIFCPIGSSGAQYAFGSWTTCPLPGALAVSSFLNGYDDWGYYNITATFSGCTCDWDYAFTNYSLGSGNYQAQGYHTANIPGYYPSAGYTFYYFSV